MVMADKEVGLNVRLSGHGKCFPVKAKNKWRRRKFSRRNEEIWNNRGPLMTHNGAYVPPRLTDLQLQNRMKTKRYYPRKLRAPGAPRNTSSFIMRSKKPGSLSLLSPVTPAILPTPVISPAPRYREGLVDEANKEWGVDGYGSMNDLIRLRCVEEGERDECGGTGESGSDLEQDSHAESVQQLEQRIDHGLSRFEIVYPSPSAAYDNNRQSMAVRVEDLENHVAQLEDENLSLKENLYLLQQELAEARRRLQVQGGGDNFSSDENNTGPFPERSVGDVSCAQS